MVPFMLVLARICLQIKRRVTMKKRNIILITALTCCLALSGCSGSDNNTDPKNDTVISQQKDDNVNSQDDTQKKTDEVKKTESSKKASPDEWFNFDKKKGKDDEVMVSGHTFSLSDENVVDLVIPDSHDGKKVTGVGSKAFYACGFSTVVIPDGVDVIESYAFRDCKNLASVSIPDSVTKIDLYAFSNCESLTSITIPEGVAEIRQSAFDGCTSLTTAYIPSTITLLSPDIFAKCDALTAIYVVKGTYADTWFSENYPDKVQYQ